MWLRPLESARGLDLFVDIGWKRPQRFLAGEHRGFIERVWNHGPTARQVRKDPRGWVYVFGVGKPKGTGGILAIRKSVQLDDMQRKFVQSGCNIMALCDRSVMPWENGLEPVTDSFVQRPNRIRRTARIPRHVDVSPSARPPVAPAGRRRS